MTGEEMAQSCRRLTAALTAALTGPATGYLLDDHGTVTPFGTSTP
ncbi:MAG TPA: hypothetical protein VGB14_13400 [Acidimicrobiales bacterium]|jgi:hypothetical protein